MTYLKLHRGAVLLSIPCAFALSACNSTGGPSASNGQSGSASSSSPSKETKESLPDYELVFDEQTVRTLHITISSEDYAAMNADLAELFSSSGMPMGQEAALGAAGGGGAPGSSGGAPTGTLPSVSGTGSPPASAGGAPSVGVINGAEDATKGGQASTAATSTGAASGAGSMAPLVGGPLGGGVVPAELSVPCAGASAGDACEASVNGSSFSSTCQELGGSLACVPEMQGGMPGGGAMGGGDLLSRDPIYVPVTVEMDTTVWKHVGMRYKGNSSLMTAYSSGNRKVPFRLDFDRYEDDWPEVKNQRFHGFGKLTFASNSGDDSQIRECFADHLLRNSDLPAVRCAFCRVVLDVGKGDEYLGLYTLVEDPADGALLERAFGSKEGNLYKPEGAGATWTAFDQESFTKKTNEDAGDYSDVRSAIDALLADRSDAPRWRQGLEKMFNVKGFLRWLAVNTVIENWDAYGSMAHNYYLYGVPSDGGRLTWIPWDQNLSLGAQGMVGPAMGGSSNQSAAQAIFHTAVDGGSWPLIRYLMDDATYAKIYREELKSFLGGAFDENSAAAKARDLYGLVAPHVVGTGGEVAGSTTVSSPEAFATAIDDLVAVIAERRQLVLQALDEYPE
ncbi:MAG TPA: CotH kinase family protein [Polyangiaceae bacterium]|nr:CotH kinase family protein [Polyangiaceae bacterium]